MDFNLADLFERIVDTVPERTAVVTPDTSLSYAALDERASRFAHYLLDVGVKPGDHVGIHSYNRPEWCEAMLGCYKARAVPINVNYRYVPDELRYLFDNADLVALVFESSFAASIASVLSGLPKLQHLIALDDGTPLDTTVGAVPYEEALEAASPAHDFPPRSPDDLYILYTGGTTGMPKGVMWRQEDIFFAAMGGGNYGGPPITEPEQIVSSVRDETRTLALAPLMHGNAQWTMYNSLFLGGTLALWTEHRFDADGIWRFVARERVGTISLVGDAMARPLVDALRERPGEYDTSSVFALVSGGAILSPSIKNDLHEVLPNVFVLDSFGASETGANGAVDPNASGPRFAMNDSTLVIGDDFRPVAPGETGMLARRGHVPLGYYKDQAKTAATFVEVDGVRWAIPGDRAVLETDGTITVLGRGSQCINTGGEKVFPEEVEAVLKSHPDVFDAIVVGVPDARWGERVAAVVEPRPDRKPTLDDVTEHCRSALAGYKLPRDLVLVAEVKRTPAGKPDYRWAKATAAEAVAAG